MVNSVPKFGVQKFSVVNFYSLPFLRRKLSFIPAVVHNLVCGNISKKFYFLRIPLPPLTKMPSETNVALLQCELKVDGLDVRMGLEISGWGEA